MPLFSMLDPQVCSAVRIAASKPTAVATWLHLESMHAYLLAAAIPQDIFSLFHLDRPFKFVSKTSNFYIPIVGWSMFLTGRSNATY